MISKGIFNTQVNDCCRILKQINLLDERSSVSPQYTEFGGSFFRKMSYIQTWKWCYQNNHYDFKLNDGAFFQFKYISNSELSYVYYEAPLLPLSTFDEFVLEHEFQEDDSEYELLRLYEYYTSDPPVKENIIPIRYDYAPKQYRSGRHPASHFHFGHRNNIRIGTKKMLRPLSFLFFILRQYYPDNWSVFLESKQSDVLCRNIRINLSDVSAEFWNAHDSYEMSLV